jgi:hypothetical protein
MFRFKMIRFKNIRRLFSAQHVTEEGQPVWSFWVGNESEAALINPHNGRVMAYIDHDGYGKFYPIIFVSPWRAIRIIAKYPCWMASLRCLPRIGVETFRIKAGSMSEAIAELEFDLDHS